MNLALFLFIFLLGLVHATLAWAPLSKVYRDARTPASVEPFSSRRDSAYVLSMRFGFTEDKVKTAPGPKEERMGLPWTSKNLVRQEPSTPSILVTKQSMSFPWMNEKSKKILVSPVEVVQDEMADAGNPNYVMVTTATAIALILAALLAANYFDMSLTELVDGTKAAVKDPSKTLDQVVQTVESMGPIGALYFGMAYTIAEVLAIPAIPLAASSGYIFGPVKGTAVVLLSASTAAAISFVIGRTLLRDYVEKALEDYPKFAKLDKAIGREGFKLMVVLRMSPVFPFALSNYLYGASSINFPAFFWGTLLGFTPGTIAYVCTGAFGKAVHLGGDSTYPWYYYAGGLTALGAFIKILADTAIKVVEEMEEEDDEVIPGI